MGNDLKIEYRNIDELTPYENNPRINDHAVDQVAASISEFGFKNPIILDENDVIIAGHTRVKAARQLGMEQVPTIKASDLTEEQAQAYRLVDNKTGELADWDFSALEDELAKLGEMDMTQFGFDELESLLEDVVEDDYEVELPSEPTAQLGDVYQLGRHRLMCGDSTDAEMVAVLMGGRKSRYGVH